MPTRQVVARRLASAEFDDAELPLAALLLDGVADGASVGFLADVTSRDARLWWRESLRAANKLTWVAADADETLIGVIQLVLATYRNSLHRAEVSKLLVHTAHRGRGVSRLLMAALEAEAARLGRRLLVLDTHSGSTAESIYRRWGWQRVGTIDYFAGTPDGTLVATTIMSKIL